MALTNLEQLSDDTLSVMMSVYKTDVLRARHLSDIILVNTTDTFEDYTSNMGILAINNGFSLLKTATGTEVQSLL